MEITWWDNSYFWAPIRNVTLRYVKNKRKTGDFVRVYKFLNKLPMPNLTQMQASTFTKVDPFVCDVSVCLFAITTKIATKTMKIPGIPNANVKQSSLPKHFTSCRRTGLIKRAMILPVLYIK